MTAAHAAGWTRAARPPDEGPSPPGLPPPAGRREGDRAVQLTQTRRADAGSWVPAAWLQRRRVLGLRHAARAGHHGSSAGSWLRRTGHGLREMSMNTAIRIQSGSRLDQAAAVYRVLASGRTAAVIVGPAARSASVLRAAGHAAHGRAGAGCHRLRRDAAGSTPGQEPQPCRPRVPGVDDRRPGDDVVQRPAMAAHEDAREPQPQKQEAQRECQRAHDRPAPAPRRPAAAPPRAGRTGPPPSAIVQTGPCAWPFVVRSLTVEAGARHLGRVPGPAVPGIGAMTSEPSNRLGDHPRLRLARLRDRDWSGEPVARAAALW